MCCHSLNKKSLLPPSLSQSPPPVKGNTDTGIANIYNMNIANRERGEGCKRYKRQPFLNELKRNELRLTKGIFKMCFPITCLALVILGIRLFNDTINR